MMSFVSHMINEHQFNLGALMDRTEYLNIVLQITLYASRAFVFLYFFIWPLNYFIRFPNLRLALRNNSG